MGQNRGLIHLVRWRGFQNFFSGSTKFSRKNVRCRDSILEDCRLMQTTLTDCTGIDAEIESLLEEIDVVTELTKRSIAENSQTAENQEEYATRYNGFVERYEKLFWTFRVPWGWTYTGGTVADWVAQFSFGFYSLMLTSLLLGLIVMVLYKPRTWCAFCPMGTMTQGICKLKNKE